MGEMAVGKNKGLAKTGKKGVKKKVVDPFTRKDWYDIKAPSVFKVRDVGKTLVNRTQGTKLASDGLKGRVYEVSLADLQNEQDAERSYKKFKLSCGSSRQKLFDPILWNEFDNGQTSIHGEEMANFD